MAFSIPYDLSEWFTIQFIILFLVSFFIFSTNNGYSTLGFLDEYYNLDINYSYGNLTIEKHDYQNYYDNLKFKTLPRMKIIAYILYFIVFPLVNYIFFIRYIIYTKTKTFK